MCIRDSLKTRRGLLLANLNRIPQRYYSQLVLDDFSYEDQKKLCESEVTIIGCGGLGSPLAVYLVAAGVGKINLIDFDVVEERNLHRQVFFKESDIDRVIKVLMYDNYYQPNNFKIKKNETIKFVVENKGELVHEFNIATKAMHLKHQPEMMMMVEREILLANKIDKKKMMEMSKKN